MIREENMDHLFDFTVHKDIESDNKDGGEPATKHMRVQLLYSGFISLGANFPKWSVLSFSRNFPNLEIHDPNNRKTHVSEILHKVYACT